jgi:hypothetical protein
VEDDVLLAHQSLSSDTYSPQISGFLKATHIVLQARNEDDVTPDHIYKRMRESSGSAYGAGNGPSSTPAASSFKSPPVNSAPKPYVPSSTSAFNKPTPGPSYNRPTGAFSKPTPSYTKPIPAPVVVASPALPPREPTPPPAPVAAAPVPSKPVEDDRIGPVGTAYEPVKLAAPKKLVNRWGQGAFNNAGDDEDKADEKPNVGGFSAARNAFMGGANASSASPANLGSGPTSGKKLTWSERQAEAKKQREDEEKAATQGE